MQILGLSMRSTGDEGEMKCMTMLKLDDEAKSKVFS